MGIMTVKGVISKEALGVTTPHEHALIDIRNQYPGDKTSGSLGFDGKVSKKHYDLLMSDPYALRDKAVCSRSAWPQMPCPDPCCSRPTEQYVHIRMS